MTISDVLVGTGGALVLGGLILYITSPKRMASVSRPQALGVAVGANGIYLKGRW
jgi:hypothetical protein